MLAKLTVFALLCMAVLFASARALGAITNPQAMQAIQRRVCFESYWWDQRAYRLGKVVPFILRRDGDVAYAWTQGLSSAPGGSSWINFFTVYAKSDRVSVGESSGFSEANVAGIQDRMRQVKGSRADIVQIPMPADCSPQFTLSTPERDRALGAIATTFAKTLASAKTHDNKHPSAREKIVIANYLSDYPETYILVPRTEQVFKVVLQQTSDPLGDGALIRGEYQIVPVDKAAEAGALKSKILKYGTAREINIPTP